MRRTLLTGASGSGAVGASGCACAGASAWPLVPALSFFCTSAVARFCMPAAMRCLHQPEGALGKSLHSHVPLQTTYCVAPLDCEAILALPSASSSTSPLRTIATALSTLPLHSGRVCLARSAISATASRHACRVVCSKPGALASSHVISFTATIVCPFLTKGCCTWPLGRFQLLSGRCVAT